MAQPGLTGDEHGPLRGQPYQGDRLRRFLHYGHVFSSAVQEILESRYIAEVSPDPLTVPQFHLLKLINLHGQHQVGEVAEFLGVSSPAVSKNIDKLEGLGLVARSPSPGDRRVTLLSASDDGRALVRRYECLKADRLTPVLAGFAPDELEQLTGLLERFAVRLFQAEEPATTFCLRCAAYGDATCALPAVGGDCPYRRTRGAEGNGTDEESVSDPQRQT